MEGTNYITGEYYYNLNRLMDKYFGDDTAMKEGLEKENNIIIFYSTNNDGSLAAFTIADWVKSEANKAQVPYNIVYVGCSNSSEKHWIDHIRDIPVREQNMIFVLDLTLSESDIDDDITNRLNTMCKIWCDHHSDTEETLHAVESGEMGYDINFDIRYRDDMCSAKMAYMVTKSFEIDLKDRTVKPKLGFVSLQDMPLVYEMIDIYHRSINDSPHWDEAVYLDYISHMKFTDAIAPPELNFWFKCCYEMDVDDYKMIINTSMMLLNGCDFRSRLASHLGYEGLDTDGE